MAVLFRLNSYSQTRGGWCSSGGKITQILLHARAELEVTLHCGKVNVGSAGFAGNFL